MPQGEITLSRNINSNVNSSDKGIIKLAKDVTITGQVLAENPNHILGNYTLIQQGETKYHGTWNIKSIYKFQDKIHDTDGTYGSLKVPADSSLDATLV